MAVVLEDEHEEFISRFKIDSWKVQTMQMNVKGAILS